MYTFFCCRPDGDAPSFEAHELTSDASAAAQAERLLVQRASCSHVIVVEGDREVATVRKPAPGLASDPVATGLGEVVRAAGAASSGAAVIVTDAQGSVVFWNDAAAKLYGWSAVDAVGANIMEVTPAIQTRQKARSVMAALQAGKPWEGEIVLKRRNGSRFAAFVADTPVGALGEGLGAIVGVSAPADQRPLVWQAQAEILAHLTTPRERQRA